MSTMNQLREGLTKAWDSLTEGWRELRELAGDALTRFQTGATEDQAPASPGLPATCVRWSMLAAEVTDDDDTVRVSLELPGLEPEDIDLEVNGDILIVRGEKHDTKRETQGRYHVMERAYGAFERALRLPAMVTDEHVDARYRSGVLSVTLHKSRRSRARRIEVVPSRACQPV